MANNSFAYIEKTMPKVIDKVFARESLTDALIGGSEIKLDFLDAKTVRITKMATTGLYNYVRGGYSGSNAKGHAQSTQEVFTLSQERYSAIPVDKLDTMDDAETVFGHLAAEFARTKVVQEFDAYRFSKLASYTSTTLGNRAVVTEANLANHIIDEFNKGLKWMADNKVPEGEMVIYVSPQVMYLIRSTTELYKKLSQSEYKGSVSFAIQNYENKPIVEVPSDEFYTNIQIGNGYYPAANSVKINFMFVWKKAPIIVKKLDWTKIYSSDEVKLDFVGYSFENLYYHDLFVADNQVPGIYACVSNTAATASASVLLPDVVADATATYSILNKVLTQPNGIIWDKIYLSASATIPAIGDNEDTTNWTKIGEIGASALNSKATFTHFVPDSSHNVFVATYDGKVVAVSKDFDDSELPVG